MSDATANTLFDAYKKNPERFTEPEKAPKDVKAFRKLFSVPLRDFNTAGVVAAHTGTPVSKLQDRYYPVYGAEVRVSSARIEDCREAIDEHRPDLIQGLRQGPASVPGEVPRRISGEESGGAGNRRCAQTEPRPNELSTLGLRSRANSVEVGLVRSKDIERRDLPTLRGET